MLSFLHKPKADLAIDLDDKSIYPGDTLNMRLYLTPQENFRIRGGTVELTCTEVYWRMVTTTTGKTTSTSNRKFRRKLFKIKESFLGVTDLTSGMTLNQSASLTIPADAAPTISGKTASITWEIDAKLDIPKMRDIHEKRSLIVRSIPTAAAVDEKGWSSPSYSATFSSDQCDLNLSINTDTIGAGQSLQGSIEAQVKKKFDVRKVRVELEVREKAGNKSSAMVADSALLDGGPISFHGADFRRWQFRLKTPDNQLPSVATSSTSVRWLVKGIMDRRMKQDISVEKGIQVY